ncbi:Required for respiratory growth protein 9 mitochondrial [Diaporthe australafricana]|uniref:Required for respiratory growth protein 9, mitochondrial n=1 Tax=Diaporthe australafricana TaxID=127596 RepID=A0ABR3W8K8_9PEZI
MACSCRTAALQIFVRSLAQVHAPKTQHVRSAWLETRPRLPIRNTSIASNYRRAHSSASASDAVTGEVQHQQALPGEQHVTRSNREPPSSSQQPEATGSPAGDDSLFSIKLRSKNAIRKAARYPKQPEPPLAAESQVQATEESKKQDRNSWDSADGRIEPTKKVKHRWGDRAARRAEARRAEVQERQATKIKNQEPKVDGRPDWAKQKAALKQKFPDGWRPPKRLSPDALEGIRVLHQQFPDMYTTDALADKFEVSPEAIRRILRTKWEPTVEEEEDRERRWFNRGVNVWQRYAELGRKPPRRWREAGVEVSRWASHKEDAAREEEDAGVKVDRDTATRLQAQKRLSKNLM